ncbi:hypothetical protein [Acinetobacter baumannii]|uniref:hypothetical protein n=1 Tax=Acinetobacter baumannii TaxID=470 RepID=UPI003D006C75
MANNLRDNFSKSTIDSLRRRAGGICSNPDCYVQTSEPQLTNSTKVTDTGIAAHICAASSKGPRFNNQMSSEERKNINNGIWLCAHCATKIDREPDAYPVELLREWKNKAELRIRQNSNSKLFTYNETKFSINHALLESMGISIPNKLQISLSEIAKAIKSHINNLDPRLDINYSFLNGANYFDINITEETGDPITVSFTPININEYKEKFTDLLDHGQSFSCDISNAKSNSEGLNILFPDDMKDGILKVENSNKIDAIVEIQDNEGNTLFSFEDKLILGRSTFSFNSSKYNGLISLKINRIPYSNTSTKNGINLNLNFKIWENTILSELFFFNQIFRLYKSLFNSKTFITKIYINGLETFTSNSKIDENKIFWLYRFLSYTYYCRDLSNILGLNILFKSNINVTSVEYRDIFETFQQLKTIQRKDNFESTITINKNQLFDIYMLSQKKEIIIEQEIFIDLDNIFNISYFKKLYIRHTFFKPTLSIKKTEKKFNSIIEILINNTKNTGIYKRIAVFTPLSEEINYKSEFI